MQFVAILSLALGLARLPLTLGISIETPLATRDITPSWVSTIQTDLGPLLSSSAEILFPSSPSWDDANSRWTSYGRPEYAAILEVGSGEDVIEAVSN
jgi:hypothetical protein